MEPALAIQVPVASSLFRCCYAGRLVLVGSLPERTRVIVPFPTIYRERGTATNDLSSFRSAAFRERNGKILEQVAQKPQFSPRLICSC